MEPKEVSPSERRQPGNDRDPYQQGRPVSIVWTDPENETEVILIEDDVSEGGISSESEGSGADCAARVGLSRPVKDIWPTEEIVAELERFPGGRDAACLGRHGRRSSKDVPGGVLWACWLGRASALSRILASGASPHAADTAGRTGMHLAALVGSDECLAVLIRHGAKINLWDKERRAMPLHCAASARCLKCVQILLDNGADVNAGITQRSPLHYAVQSNAPECVLELLKRGASPDTPQVYTETPLHVAASRGLTECLKILLEHGADARAQLGKVRATALHLAAEEGHTECARVLIEAGAYIDACNSKYQTPLHLASIAQASDVLELLIRKGAKTGARDADGRTPLHGALGRASRCGDCVALLISARANVNEPDNFGYTPMHLAALNEFSGCVNLLLDNGGDVTLCTKGGHSVLSFIVRRTPEVIPRYISKFDDAIKVTDHEIGDVDCELKLDFRPLVPSVGRAETALLLTFIEVGRRDVLKHPLCETFLYLKWRKIRKFFLSSLIYHTMFVILYTIFIMGVYLKDCPSTRSAIMIDTCSTPLHILFVGYLLIFLNFVLMAKEFFQIFHNLKGYVREWENWLQWTIILGVFLCMIPGTEDNIKRDVATWKHHIAAISIFLAWLELMLIVGRFPMFGLYVQMFKTVAVNFSKFLMAYSCLLIAFSLSFGVLFANNATFSNVYTGLLKTVIMMSGELEYEDMFYNSTPILYPVTTHVLFLGFVILVTVILTNLLVGLAVSDIQALQESACLDRLVRQAELVGRLESMLFSQFLYWVPPRVLAMLHKAALLLSSRSRWALSIRPNDPRENRIPSDLISSIYKLVAGKKDSSKYKNNAKNNYSIQSKIFDSADSERHNHVKKTYSILRTHTTKLPNLSSLSVNSCQDIDIKIMVEQINNFVAKFEKWQQKIEDKLSSIEISIQKKM